MTAPAPISEDTRLMRLAARLAKALAAGPLDSLLGPQTSRIAGFAAPLLSLGADLLAAGLDPGATVKRFRRDVLVEELAAVHDGWEDEQDRRFEPDDI